MFPVAHVLHWGMKPLLAAVVLVLLIPLFSALGACGPPEYSPPPPPARVMPTPSPTVYPVETVAPAGDTSGDADVYVGTGGDDGESWFCQRRRWC